MLHPDGADVFHDRCDDRLRRSCSDFGENTDRDLKHALHDLASKGMRRLLLDIREQSRRAARSGDQGRQTSSCRSGRMIVYTRGRVTNSDQDYRATEDGEFTDIPIVVMANRSSASASEIVTGALQDHDRAYIVGETTFGKALVQSIYRASAAARGLALTTAHYYTPSGRLIQRPVGCDLRRVSRAIGSRIRRRAAAQPERSRDEPTQAVPCTAAAGSSPTSGSPVLFEGFNPGRFGRTLQARQAFDNYAQKFTADGDTRVAQQSTGRQVVKPNFVVDDAMVADFREQSEEREDPRSTMRRSRKNAISSAP